MNSTIKNSIAFFGNSIPLSILRSHDGFPPFLPFYHVVSNEKLDYINSYKIRSVQQFKLELDYLLKHFKAVSLEEIFKSPGKNKMHLTFDDGLKECSAIIAPILKQKGIPATFFVNPDFVDNKQLFHRFKRAILESNGLLNKTQKKYFLHEAFYLDELAKEQNIDFSSYQPYMSLAEVQALHNDGFGVGAHSLNHPEMWLLSEEEQFTQIVESMNWVVRHFNPKTKAFSFPFTDDGLKMSLFDRLHQENIVDVTFGTAGLKYDKAKNHLQRIPVEQPLNWSIKKVVHFEYFYYSLRSFFNKNSVKR